MMTDKRAKSLVTGSYILGHNAGVAKTSAEFVKAITVLLDSVRWHCTKHQECPDFNHWCSRKTGHVCAFRVENPNYKEAMQDIKNIMHQQRIL